MATLDILTVDEAQQAALGVASGHEATIARMNAAVSARIDELVGPVVNRTVTEYHDGGVAALRPRMTPLSSVTTLRHWNGSTTVSYTEDSWGVTGNASGFLVEQSGVYPHDVRIFRRSSGSNVAWPAGHRAIELVYVAGRAATTAAVAALYKEAAAEVLRRLWDREASAWGRAGDPFADDAGVSSRFHKVYDHVIREHLGDEFRPPPVA